MIASAVTVFTLGALAGQLAPLTPGAPIPRWKLAVENPAAWGADEVDLRAFYEGGDRVDEQLIVTFGASWCGPCKLELKALVELRPLLDEMRTRVAVVVADSEPEGRAAMVAWLKDELQVPFAVVADDLGLLARRYRTTELPASFVADRSGALIWAHAGWDDDTLPALLDLLRRDFEAQRRAAAPTGEPEPGLKAGPPE